MGRLWWLFGRWTRSFWAMRWRPGDYEIGHWDDLRLRQAARRARENG